MVVKAAATIKGSAAQSASLCLLIGAASWDAPDPVDLPESSLGNGNWEQTLFGVPKVSTGNPLYKQGSVQARPLLIGWIAYVEVAWHE
jgi:hypothetical protein